MQQEQQPKGVPVRAAAAVTEVQRSGQIPYNHTIGIVEASWQLDYVQAAQQ
jgi:hypothetical protein